MSRPHLAVVSDASRDAGFYVANAHRFDVYRTIHKALRAMMIDTLARAGRIDCDDPACVAETAGRIRDLLALCRAHIEKENRYVHRALESCRPGATLAIAAEHAAHEAAIDLLAARVRTVESATGESRRAAAHRLYHELSLFVAENLVHMVTEETTNNALLWANYDDEEIAAIHDAIVASVSPADMQTILRWMIPALSPAERANLLDAIRHDAPVTVFDGVRALADDLLEDADRAKLDAALAA